MQVPKNKQTFDALCQEANVFLPYSDNTKILNSALIIKNKIIPNRIAYQAMEGCDSTFSGEPDVLTKRRYMRFAKGGPGVIWFEATAVKKEGRANPRQSYLDESNVDAFARLLEDMRKVCLKENGYTPLIICQLTHSGRYSKPEGKPAPLIAYNDPIFEGNTPISSDRIVTDEYLDSVGEALVHSATLAEKAGFDGVDIKSCHRYLLCELLSAFERPGKYGGSFENRTRLLRTAVNGAMQVTDKDFIVSSRLNIYDGFVYPYGFGVTPDNGIVPNWTEAKLLATELAKLGMPLLNLTMGNPYFNPHVNRPYAQGGYLPPEHPMQGVDRMLRGIKEVASVIPNVPVISSGLSFLGQVSQNVVAACIEENWFAMAGYGRATLANPEIAKEILQNGCGDSKKTCMACGKCTEIMRCPGGTPGCAVRDTEVYTPIYKQLVLKK